MDDYLRMRTSKMHTPPYYPHLRSTNTDHRRQKPISAHDSLSSEDFSDVFGGPPKTVLSSQFSSAVDPRTPFSRCSFYEDIFRSPEAPSQCRTGRSLPEFRIPGQARKTSDGFYRNIFGWKADNTIGNNEDDDDDDDDSYSTNNGSPKTIWFEPTISTGSFKMSEYDSELESPLPLSSSSSDSSCGEELKTGEMENDVLRHDEALSDEEVMSSYVIEINSDIKEGSCESNDLDEAIAWAKESFQKSFSEATTWSPQNGEKEKFKESPNGHQLSEGFPDSLGSSDVEHNSKEETGQPDIDELRMLDEKIRLWSTGKEADIRLLLSSLHHILWHDSGWLAVSIANLIEISKVKKAYQKARLCLHPDKLQQKGATPSHKYIADKAFCILQDAWASFNSSHDVYCR